MSLTPINHVHRVLHVTVGATGNNSFISISLDFYWFSWEVPCTAPFFLVKKKKNFIGFATVVNSTRWQRMEQDLLPNWNQPLHYQPSPWKFLPHHRGLRPLLFTDNSVSSFTSHKNQNSEFKELWGKAYGFSSFSEMTRMSLFFVSLFRIALCSYILQKRV